MKVTLYVQGAKSVAGIDDRSRWGYSQGSGLTADYGSPQAFTPDYKVYREVEYKSVLPEDQRGFVEMTQTLAEKYGFELEIIDVTKKNLLRKLVQKQLKHINTFPTLISEKGDKIEGYTSEKEIRKLLGLKERNRH